MREKTFYAGCSDFDEIPYESNQSEYPKIENES